MDYCSAVAHMLGESIYVYTRPEVMLYVIGIYISFLSHIQLCCAHELIERKEWNM